ncbi:MMPL family transporter [Myxococcota bacterium]|nr:MMPL family transporter [Myxococcota bacterium]MBU1512102.1 MMPL family transporter [Myxococcota bacterium]
MIEKWLTWWTRQAIARPLLWLGVFGLLLAAGLFGTSRLGLSTNLNLLLPQNTESVKTAREASRRIGSTDFLIVGIEGPDPERNREVADALVFAMRRDFSDLSEISARVEVDFFKRNALLYFDLPRLEQLLAQLKTVVGRSRLKSMGLLVLPEGEDPEEKKLEDIVRNSDVRARVPGEFQQTAAGKKPKGLEGYFASPDGTILAVIAKPEMLSVDMATARSLVYRTEALIAMVLQDFPAPHPKVEVGGGYRNRVAEYDSILKDITSSFLLSFGLIALLVVLFFRSLRPLPLIFLPLILGILLTLGITRGVAVDKLNIITAFIGGILLGMGIDFGVHLSVRYFHERTLSPLEEALTRTMTASGRALLTAAATTSGALYLLFFSNFRGFWEFGLIAGTGVLLTMLSFFFFFPVFAVLLERVFTLRPRSGWEWNFGPAGDPGRFPKKSVFVLATFFLASVLFLPWGLSRLEFETNFRRLSGNPSTSVQYGKAMGDRASPTVMMCDSAADCEKLTTYWEDQLTRPLHHPEIRDMNSMYSFIPKQQEAKLAILEKIREQLMQVQDWADESLQKKINHYLQYVPSVPIGPPDLPEWIRLRFTESNGELGKFIYLYPARETWNAHEAAQLKKAISRIDLEPLGAAPGAKARAASSSFILVDILEVVRREGVIIMFAALGLVFLLLLADFRRLSAAVVVSLPLVGALFWIAALLPLLGQRLGLYNMVVLSTIIGTGIDSSVHLYHSGREYEADPRSAFFRTGQAVCMAALTTLVGFAGMLWVQHGGLSSIGRLATLGLSATLLCALILVPSGFFVGRWLHSFKSRKG